jgi:5-methylcytosine-specific restriction endonuclease McrA
VLLREKIARIGRIFFATIREDAKSLHRSPGWHLVRESHLKMHSICASCGCSEKLQVHHVVPVSVDPQRELDPSNLITLCMGENECHLNVGHNGSWKKHNPHVREIARALLMFSNDP